MKKKITALALTAVMALSMAACTISDPTVANVGDYKVKLSEYDFYLDNLKQQMQGTEFSQDSDWETFEINGRKAIDVLRDRALETAKINIAYIEIYEKMGNKFTSDVKDKIKEIKDNVVSQYDQNGGYKEFLKESGITDEFVDLLCKSMYCSEMLYTDFSQTAEVTDEEVQAFYDEYQNEYFTDYLKAKHVLIKTIDDETNKEYTEEQKAEAKKKADNIYKRALAGEDFDSLVKEYSEDPGSKTNPGGYVFGPNEMVQEFEDCTKSLEIGKIGFCESSYGYHIVQRLPVEASSFASQIKSQITSNKFMEYIGEKMTEYEITIEETPELQKAIESEKAEMNDSIKEEN